MPITQHTDANGWTYNAVSTAEWYGAYGEQLRAAGWRYCGYGTWGIYIAQGSNPCATKSGSTQPPFIQPPVVAPPPDNQTPSGAVTDKACGGCRKSSTPTTQPGAPAPAPTPGARPAPVSSSPFPWWVWVLVALYLAQVAHGRNN